jgi:hypothetical protein
LAPFFLLILLLHFGLVCFPLSSSAIFKSMFLTVFFGTSVRSASHVFIYSKSKSVSATDSILITAKMSTLNETANQVS